MKKILETQMFGKRFSKNLSKILSQPCQTSKIENFAKVVNYQKPLIIFVKSSNLDV